MLTLPNRRTLLTGALALAASPALGSPAMSAPAPGLKLGPARPFSFDALKARAREMAKAAYAERPPREEAVLDAIDFDAYQKISYRPELSLWGDVPGAQAVRLFPMGRYFRDPVSIYMLEGGQAREVVYSPELFETPPGHPLRKLTKGGFAGFRLMHADGKSDWMAFLGASYFRSAGPFDQYGASARGLAINSGGPAAEEFPHFSAFWLEAKPGGVDAYALLESPSVVGAYRITNRDGGPGGEPVQEIEAELNFRAPVETLGLCPLTSMYWYGEAHDELRTDWRPEVHDSDGLAMWTGADERIWRPLNNPPRVITNSFVDTNPKGFGLIQRDRNFENYQDDGVFYEKRASLWVEPMTAFGPGSVRLVELKTVDETNDNIVAFWTPEAKVVAGTVISTRYRIRWTRDTPPAPGGRRIVATRIGAGGRPGLPPVPGTRKFVIDVEGGALKGLTRQSGVKTVVTASRGKLSEIYAYPVVGTDRWRMTFDIGDLGGQPTDLRAYLQRGTEALSETWLYQQFP